MQEGWQVMIKTFLARLTKKKVVFALVLGVLLITSTLYLTSKKLEEHDICWKTLSRPSDDVLYNQAIRSYVEYLLTESIERNKKYDKYDSFKDIPRWGSEVWQLPPMTEEKIKAKLLSIEIKSPNNVKKVLGYKKLLDVSELGEIKPENNAFSIADNLPGYHQFTPKDCCKIYTAQQIQQLKNQYGNTRPPWESGLIDWKAPANLKSHYLSLRDMSILSLFGSNTGGNPDADMILRGTRFKFEKHFFTERFIPLNACGAVVMPKPVVDY